MLFLRWLFPMFFYGVRFSSHIKFRSFSFARIMRKHLSSLEFLFKVVLVMLLQLLYLFRKIIFFRFNKNRFRLMDDLLFGLLVMNFTRICQVIEPFGFLLMISITLKLHLPFDNFLKIMTVGIIFNFFF